MPIETLNRLRVAAIGFLNPAPLMWNFEHPPESHRLRSRYDIHTTSPAQCADELLSGRAGLGLIPIAALTPDLAVVPGCTIAALHEVRSILLLVRGDRDLHTIRTVAADTASRSSLAYTEVLLRSYIHNTARFLRAPADPIAMLEQADAALLIGDPALLARERRAELEAALGPCRWFDLAKLWRAHTGLPWVAAVWAANPDALAASSITPEELTRDLIASRDAGLDHIEQIVTEWSTRLPLPVSTIRTYLTHNIHYHLDAACIQTTLRFRAEAAALGILPALPQIRWLT